MSNGPSASGKQRITFTVAIFSLLVAFNNFAKKVKENYF